MRHPGLLRGGFEPLGLSAFPDVVSPAFASLFVRDDQVFDRRSCSNQLSYGPMEGPAGLEPATWRLQVDVVHQAFVTIISVTATRWS
jgi:hypothetical protein